mgnify:FL=1
MVWAGSPFAHRIEFSIGLPTGAVAYQLLGNDRSLIIDEELTPAADELSCLIVIDGVNNTCDKPLFENRTLVYHYTTGEGLVSDQIMYRVQRPIPFAPSVEGVRTKLGVEKHELADSDVDLVGAYAEFSALFDDGALTEHETSGDRSSILCTHAIEAIAGLQLIGALQLKLAQRESSGTNQYQRFPNTDWSLIESTLAAHVDRARAAIDPAFDGAGGTVTSFLTATRPDAITGA